MSRLHAPGVLRHGATAARRPRRRAQWGCLLVLITVVATCCVPLVGSMNALAALGHQRGDDLAGSGRVADIPPRMLAAYRKAARLIHREVPRCTGMSWTVLAGIAKVESGHANGRTITKDGDIRPRIYGVMLDGSGAGGNTSAHADSDNGRWDGTAAGDRAVGPFQFIPATWHRSGRDADKDGTHDPHNAQDAALGAAVYLCGRGRDLTRAAQLRAAILQYNHSTTYLGNVLGWIRQYRAAAKKGGVSLSGVTGDTRTVLKAALSQRGVPYSWGGGGPKGPTTGICCSPSGKSGASVKGYDCSGLTQYAYAKAGVRLPRTAAAQAAVGKRIPAGAGTDALKRGDLVFYSYGGDAAIYHVGIYAGGGQMVNAPRPGAPVRVDPVDAMPGYAGGARIL